MKLILASSSRYRQALLQRLQIPFDAISADVNENPHAEEAPAKTASRLARAKAETAFSLHPQATVIGSDQTACVEIPANQGDLAHRQLLGKPGDFESAREQLTLCSGGLAVFHTALCVLGPQSTAYEALVDTTVSFRDLSPAEIENYLRLEQPYDCAGSFKCEGLGISLFNGLESEDPTALEGLPLITLSRILREIGFELYPAA